MLNKFEVAVAREEVERVDTLRYSFGKLLSQAVRINNNKLLNGGTYKILTILISSERRSKPPG